MRCKMRLTVATVVVGMGVVSAVSAAAPATPSYQGVEQTIETIHQAWSKPGARPQPNRPGWDALFDSVLNDLRSYTKAENETERLAALDHLYQISGAISAVAWQPAASLRDEVREWLRPRVRLAWARRRLSETVQALPATSDPNVQANRARWVDFVRNDLGKALREYDAAATVAQRRAALARIHESLDSLKQRNKQRPWWPSSELEAAVNDLFNRPNIDVSADANTVAPLFNANLVETGPVLRKGYLSQVTAGPKTGFGLLPSNDGIAFYNSQLYTTVTPIWDFQNQVASNPQGQRAIKLYQFSATTYDWAELTITTVLKSSGLEISPSYRHSIDAGIGAAPTEGGGLGRAIASLIGMNQERIRAKVYEGSIGEFRQRIPVEAQEEGAERIAAQTATRNADLRLLGLLGNGALAIRDFLITQLSMRSQPAGVSVGGVLQWQGAPGQAGADAPLPQKMATIEPGIAAGVHLGSLLTSLAAGAYQREQVQSVQNLMIAIRDVPPGTPPREAVTVTKNVDFATFAKAVEDSRKPMPGTPKAAVLRITRPQRVPEFSADARGFLVAMIHDLQIEVPAPGRGSQGRRGRRGRQDLPDQGAAGGVRALLQGRLTGAGRLEAPRQGGGIQPGHQCGSAGDHRRRNQGGCPLSLLGRGGARGHRRQDPHAADRPCPRPAQAAGLLDPLDLAARPQRLDARRPRPESQQSVAAGQPCRGGPRRQPAKSNRMAKASHPATNAPAAVGQH